MTIEIFLFGLAICSALTSLITEAVKATVNSDSKFMHSNLLVALCSVVSALWVIVGYVIFTNSHLDKQSVLCAVMLVIMSWLCAMVGYDKVKQTIRQLVDGKTENAVDTNEETACEEED